MTEEDDEKESRQNKQWAIDLVLSLSLAISLVIATINNMENVISMIAGGIIGYLGRLAIVRGGSNDETGNARRTPSDGGKQPRCRLE